MLGGFDMVVLMIGVNVSLRLCSQCFSRLLCAWSFAEPGALGLTLEAVVSGKRGLQWSSLQPLQLKSSR